MTRQKVTPAPANTRKSGTEPEAAEEKPHRKRGEALKAMVAEYPDMKPGSGFATVAEACVFLRLSRASVYELMMAKKIAHAKFGRARRIPWSALQEYAQSCLVAV